jgi:hypothetical protein
LTRNITRRISTILKRPHIIHATNSRRDHDDVDSTAERKPSTGILRHSKVRLVLYNELTSKNGYRKYIGGVPRSIIQAKNEFPSKPTRSLLLSVLVVPILFSRAATSHLSNMIWYYYSVLVWSWPLDDRHPHAGSFIYNSSGTKLSGSTGSNDHVWSWALSNTPCLPKRSYHGIIPLFLRKQMKIHVLIQVLIQDNS